MWSITFSVFIGDFIWLKRLTLEIKIKPCSLRLKFKGNNFYEESIIYRSISRFDHYRLW